MYITELLINLLIIATVIVYVQNHSGFVFNFTKWLYEALNPGKMYLGKRLPKILSCALCQTHWFTLIYSLCNGYTIIQSLGLATGFAILSILIDKIIAIIIKLINKIS